MAQLTTILKGAGIVFVGSLFGAACKYFYELLIARFLGAALFGIFFLGLAIFRLCETVSTAGLHYGVLRYVAIFSGENDRGRIKGTILFCLKVAAAISAITAVVLFLSSNVIAVRLFDKYELSTVLKIFSIAIPFTAVTSILLFASQGFKVMAYRVAVRDIFEPVSRILIVIVLFAVGLRMEGAIIAFILSIILASFLAAWFLRRAVPANQG